MRDIFSRQQDVYDVTRLNREVRTLLEDGFSTIRLQGEISNLARPASGHLYFSLKDQYSQVRCVMFKNKNRSLEFVPENGIEIVAEVNVSLYENRGDFQLLIATMEPAGVGTLLRAYEKLKQQLSQQGLFDSIHKKTLPGMPKNIGVITSPTGAAIRDILSVLKRRYPAGNVIIYPVAVQGDKAAEQIIDMLNTAEQRQECDVLIIARGGGSVEDMVTFNDEKLARSVFDCTLPIISGVGHEIDFTIVDFVADQRAATPSAAAELVSPDQQSMQQDIRYQQDSLMRAIGIKLSGLEYRVKDLHGALVHPIIRIQNNMQKLDGLSEHITHISVTTVLKKQGLLDAQIIRMSRNRSGEKLQRRLQQLAQLQQRLHSASDHLQQHCKLRLKTAAGALDMISPLATLQRGYAIVQRCDDEQIVVAAQQLKTGTVISARFSAGAVRCTVDSVSDNINEDWK